ncbi:putative [ribosomal protein S5]-alanine N-acetyltransferase [Vitis riparia]|uniref:putative [ribosomal protein S5]-alanine N-acetyltransferase n=1 Tax=Vitis riparia TaxID=96939 RepID=UPI00155B1873|nr:putative [ribosomal protein S5]-alanine N-acetyltransferase [Vitis riparia]
MEWACDNKVTRSCRLRHHSSKDDTLNYLKEDAIPHPLVPSHMPGWPPNWIHFHYARFFHGEMPGNDQLYWGRGITTLAVKRAVSSAFEEFPDLERIEGIVDVNNKASQRVLEKAGFLKEGVLRKYLCINEETIDFAMYFLLSTDPILR